MPPPQRLPSLPGATQASKKAFKPPARVLSDSATDPSASRSDDQTSTMKKTVPKVNPANPNASRPKSGASSRAGSAAPGKAAAATGNGKTANTSAFSRASNLEDVEMISSDDENLDAAFDDITTRTDFQPASKAVQASTSNGTNKRKRPLRLPSLSDSSRETTPIDASGDKRVRPSSDALDEASRIGTDSDMIPLLPAPLLTRLLHESFDDKQVKISRDANALMGRYLDAFVREAVARATLAQKERKDNGDALMDVETGDDVWLDTKDLEDVAPGLVLDF